MKKSLLTLIGMTGTCLLLWGQGMNQQLRNTWPVAPTDVPSAILNKAVHVVPTANQYQALKNEYIAFIHFGPNSFTGREWGDGMEDPRVFDLKILDTDQWCRVMKAAGMKMVIFTAKHHDGFVLWQSRYTRHGIMSTGYKKGQGDVLKELAASCKKYGLKLGIYLSPADLFQIESPEGLYGNGSSYTQRTIPAAVPGRPFTDQHRFKFLVDDYNEYFLNQLFELLTEYGPISEVWFDGATPKSKGGQKYNYLAWKKLIRTLAPKAVIFGKEDIRWCGNEAGRTRDTEWNVVGYDFNPDTANYFPDMTNQDLGSRTRLRTARFLHYQPAETNTSIREGWFYRDDHQQKVRSADDVFDIYERAVGGNSIFLLNIPPNQEGRFSERDVQSLTEAGQRIEATYSKSLFSGASGPRRVLDHDPLSFELVDSANPVVLITTPAPVTINRLMLQESVTTHSERVESHILEAWIDGVWKPLATATNIGYKRILRFPEITASKFRIRILEQRAPAAISTVAAFYYKTRPPQLQIRTDKEGRVSISPKEQVFHWNNYGENAAANINSGIEIRYTMDGSTPTRQSALYQNPFPMTGGQLRAVAFNARDRGSEISEDIGIPKLHWQLVATSSQLPKYPGDLAFDANPRTFWASDSSKGAPSITLDLGQGYDLKGFAYTPQSYNAEGMMEKGTIFTSTDGIQWTQVTDFAFGNLINDPSKRTYTFPQSRSARYVRIEASGIAGDGKDLRIAELDFFRTP
ncbi:hypothetical protein GCM10027051_17190 [Niabella terrae]